MYRYIIKFDKNRYYLKDNWKTNKIEEALPFNSLESAELRRICILFDRFRYSESRSSGMTTIIPEIIRLEYKIDNSFVDDKQKVIDKLLKNDKLGVNPGLDTRPAVQIRQISQNSVKVI